MGTKQLIGIRIKKIRKSKGLTQEKLAELVGINSKYLSSIERGKENPTLNTVLKLAESLDVNPNEIFQDIHIDNPQKIKRRINTLLKRADEDQLRGIYKILSMILK